MGHATSAATASGAIGMRSISASGRPFGRVWHLITRTLRFGVGPGCLALGLLLSAGITQRAGAQPPPPICGSPPCYNPPPTITIENVPSFTTSATMTPYVSLCYPGYGIAAESVFVRGAYQSGWTWANGGGSCPDTSSHSVSLNLGTNTFSVVACSSAGGGNMGECGDDGDDTYYDNVQVTPHVTTFANAGVSYDTSFVFTITNYQSSSGTYNLTTTCSGSGVSSCVNKKGTSVTIGGSSSVQDTVTFTTGSTVGSTGTVQVKAVYASNSAGVDSGYVNVTAQWPPLFGVTTTYTNQEDQDMGRCAQSCFAAVTSMSTVPYYSRDASRNVTLIYNGDRLARRPIVMANVDFVSSLPYTVKDLELRVQVNGAWVQFTNGQDTLHFNPSALVSNPYTPYRIGGQFSDTAYGAAGQYPLGSYPMKIVVTAVFTDNQGTYAGTEQVVDSTHCLVVANPSKQGVTGYPKGWLPADFSNLYWPSEGYSTYMAIVEGDGSARLYETSCNNSPPCTYVSSTGAVTDTLVWPSYSDSVMERHFIDGSKWLYAMGTGTGVIIARIDRLGDTVQYGYNANHQMVSRTDPFVLDSSGAHSYTVLKYNSAGLLDSIVEPGPYPKAMPGGGRVTYLSDSSADSTLTSWKDPDGVSTRFVYDAAHRLTKGFDRRGDSTMYVYAADSSWKLAQIIAPPVPIDSASTGSPVTESPTTNLQSWQMSGVPHTATSETSQATPVLTSSIVATVTNAEHHTSTYTPDQWGQPLIAVDALNDTTTITRDANGYPSVIKHPGGGHDQFSYTNGLLVWKQPAGGDTVYYSYGAFNQLKQVSGRHRSTTVMYLEAANGLVDSTAVNGVTTNHVWYTYQPYVRVDSTVDVMGHTTYSSYDAHSANRSKTWGKYSAQVVTLTFDGHGRDSVIVNGVNPAQTILYDSIGRRIAFEDGVHLRPDSTFYDAMFEDSVIDPLGQIYRVAHNALGWETSRKDPAKDSTIETYTQNGVLATFKNRRGQLSTYRYDALDRPLAKHDPGASDSATFSYSIAVNNLQRVAQNALETDTYYTDSTGWLDSVTTNIASAGKTYRQHYKHNDRFELDSAWFSPNSLLNFTFANMRMVWDTLSGELDSSYVNGNGVRYHYTAEFLGDSITYPSSVVQLDSVGAMDTHQTTVTQFMQNGSELVSLDTAFFRSYSYDSSGKLIEEDRFDLNGVYGHQFRYDGTGELIQDKYDTTGTGYHCVPNKDCWGQSGLIYTGADSVTYDSAGNILSSVAETGTDTTTTGTYKVGNRDSAWIAPGDTLRYWYDVDGERDSLHGPGGTKSYTWASDGRLLSVKAGSRTISYEYNADGLLMQRSINGVVDRYFLWDRGNLRAEVDSTGANRISEYLEPSGIDRPLARVMGSGTGTVHFYVQDATGSVLGQFSGTTLEEDLRYDPWGNLQSVGTTLSDTTRLRWKGLYWEGDSTQMYYMRGRWYDPAERRFASEDPLGIAQGVNDYAYAGGDPVLGSDPSGLGCVGEDGDGSVVPCGGSGGGEGFGGGGEGEPGFDNTTPNGPSLDLVCTGNVSACYADAQTLLTGGSISALQFGNDWNVVAGSDQLTVTATGELASADDAPTGPALVIPGLAGWPATYSATRVQSGDLSELSVIYNFTRATQNGNYVINADGSTVYQMNYRMVNFSLSPPIFDVTIAGGIVGNVTPSGVFTGTNGVPYPVIVNYPGPNLTP